jgi:hypothetical protein
MAREAGVFVRECEPEVAPQLAQGSHGRRPRRGGVRKVRTSQRRRSGFSTGTTIRHRRMGELR